MAQFDVYPLRGGGMVVDCQSDFVTYFDTRLVAPLLPLEADMHIIARLQPVLEVAGEKRVLATQYLATLPRRELSAPVASLADQEYAIKAALDMLISGF
jgi:toxin CcdB